MGEWAKKYVFCITSKVNFVLEILAVWFCGLAHLLVKKNYIEWFNKNYILYPDPVFIHPQLGLSCPVESSYFYEGTNFVCCFWGFMLKGISMSLLYIRLRDEMSHILEDFLYLWKTFFFSFNSSSTQLDNLFKSRKLTFVFTLICNEIKEIQINVHMKGSDMLRIASSFAKGPVEVR